MKRLLLTAVLVGCVLASGCAQDQPDTPSQETITVAISPAARHTGLAVSTCATGIEDTKFEISEIYPSQAEADLLIRLGEPPSGAGFAAQIARDELVVVLHPDNPASSLTLDEIQQLFSGNTPNWAELGGADAPVEVWSLLPADETRQAFTQTVLENGLIATNASLAPTPEIMVEMVAGNENAIGFLPKSWRNSDLVSILPGVSLPVLVIADNEPQGPARELVACLQGEIGQELLSAYFQN